MMELSAILISLTLLAIPYFLLNYFRVRLDPGEPPLIHSKIPIVGHIVGLIRYGIPYYSMASEKHSLPAFTLDILSTKIYIVNAASLVAAVQRNSRIISFDPFLTAAANRMSGIEGDGLKLLQETKSGGGGINNKVLHAMHPALLGEGLDTMNRKMIVNLKKSLDDLKLQEHSPFDLHAWCRHSLTVASTDAVYGPLSPYKSKEVEKSLWDFESNLSILLLKMAPRITAPKAFQAREKVVASFVRYYEAGGHENSSQMTYGRWKTQHDAGATIEDIARLETAAGIGILSNTVPSTFWTLFEIYSRPDLVTRLREEVLQHAVHIESQESGPPTHAIDLADIRDHCVLLVSTFQEVLRLRSNGAPTRVVYDDVVLNDQYLLKAGSVLQLPAHSINREEGSWGPQAEDFDPERFLPKQEKQKDRKSATSYMSFGASPNICPGRHFASGEILALVAMMLMRYDVTPGRGRWDRPKLNPRAMAASITPPVEAFSVRVSPRKEFENARWGFRVTEGKGKFNLITG
ncbi:MAG: hypothetical protein M1817_006783 [Caeruleum heppii]|nr:MAG: hypothetical protein M1817_006783 [Caeruleum heppii]